MNKFDLEAIYDAEIAPLMTKISNICQAHKMPMFAAFLYMNDPDGDSGVCSTNLMFQKERPVPRAMLSLEPSLRPRSPIVRMRVMRGDGTVKDTVVLP
jgi:hypothetical protein